MPATVIIERLTGAGPTVTNITGINTRVNAEDAHSTAGVANSIQVPTDPDIHYSYWCTTRLNVTADDPGGATVDNVRWYTDGSNDLAQGISMIAQGATSYVRATGRPGITGDELTLANHPGLFDDPVDAFSFTAASPPPLSLPTTPGPYSDLVVYQFVVDDTASAGASGQEQVCFKWDEVEGGSS